MIDELKMAKSEDLMPLHKKASELLAIFVASIATVKKRITK